jgi:hypothetical protein
MPTGSGSGSGGTALRILYALAFRNRMSLENGFTYPRVFEYLFIDTEESLTSGDATRDGRAAAALGA